MDIQSNHALRPFHFTYKYYPQEVALTGFHNNREITSHVYGKRQTSDSTWVFLRMENKQIKTVQNNSYG